MALVWASTQDVTDRWIGENPLPATDAQIATLLEDAEDVILREFKTLEADVAAGTVPARRVAKVAARMVIRHLQNPSGMRQVQHTAGPFMEGLTYGGAEPGALYLTDEDRAELGGARSRSAFMIDMTPADVRNGTFT